MKTTRNRALSEQYLAFAEDEVAAGRLTDGDINRIRMGVAAELFVYFNDEEASMKVLNRVPEAYFITQLELDIKDDESYAANMAEYAYHLELRGVTSHSIIRPTQLPAKA